MGTSNLYVNKFHKLGSLQMTLANILSLIKEIENQA